MPDFSRLSTPADDGEVLVVPSPKDLVRAVRDNYLALKNANAAFLDSTVSACRRRTREKLIGRDVATVIVIGHQPEFIHPGVWAKHIVAFRLAQAAGGVALNLVVDSDVPKKAALEIPAMEGERVQLVAVPIPALNRHLVYEQTPACTGEEINGWERSVRAVPGSRFDASLMPSFFAGIRQVGNPRDWVEQMVGARQAMESEFGIRLDDRRVSDVALGPWVVELLRNARRFAASYNRSLARYRAERGIRGGRHPMPDLLVDDRLCETPLWAYRDRGPRRRVFVEEGDGILLLLAGGESMATIPGDALTSCAAVADVEKACDPWRIRPRALALTLWARLFLADLFIHGIGGAKYDRITDLLIDDYFGIAPPAMACVSATLHLGIPRHGLTAAGLRALRRDLRDRQWNPQRHVSPADDLEPLLWGREAALRKSQRLREAEPRNRRARREAFQVIRSASAEILRRRPDLLHDRRRDLQEAISHLENDRLARGREYFFGLFDRQRLHELLTALPQTDDLRV